MLGLVDRRDVDSEERVGEVGKRQAGRVREVEIDDEGCEEAHEEVEAELVEAGECVLGPDLAVAVTVPEHDVLLEDGLCGRGGVSWGLGMGNGEAEVAYIVLEVQIVDIFGTALGLISRDGQVRTSNARLVDDGVNVGCLGTLGRGRTFGDCGNKVDVLFAFDGLDGVSGDTGDNGDRHLGWLFA